MKAITVEISAFYGYGCGGGAYSSEETFVFGVNNKVGDIVAALKKDNKCVDQNVLRAAIDNGHTELQPLWAGIEAKHEDMVARYWLFEADNECIDESLEPYFRDDTTFHEDKMFRVSVIITNTLCRTVCCVNIEQMF